jgi:release factor glutamine methyltransferase
VFSISGPELWHWRSLSQKQAIANAIDVFELDWLLLELSDLDRLSLRLANRENIQLEISWDNLQTLWQRRVVDRVPVQYLVGHSHWRQFQLKVSPAVLIPRPETELMIDLAAAHPDLAMGNWVDLGTGSGAIAIGLADIFPQAHIHAVDLSQEALAIARENAVMTGFADRITFYQGSWFEPIAHLTHQLNGLISNPPYIPSDVVLSLEPEVTLHEPHAALDGGADGLDDLRHLITIGQTFLQPGGFFAVEMMAGQGDRVAELLETAGGYRSVQIVNDLAGCDRFVTATKSS